MTRNVIICEGPDDQAFLNAFRNARNLHSCRFRIETTRTNGDYAGGVSKIGIKLKSLGGIARKKSIPEKALIFADSDDDPDQQFSDICRQIEDAWPGCAPNSQRIPSTSRPMVMVVLIPFDAAGCLEAYCYEAAKTYDRTISGHVEQFGALVGIDNSNRWQRENSKGKFRLRSLLAAVHDRDPFIFLGSVFAGRNTQAYIPLDHTSFDGLEAVIRDFFECPD